MKLRARASLIALVLIQAVLAFNCGQNSPAASSTGTNNITITISPSSSAVAAGQSEQLTAKVSGTSQTGVTWSITSSSGNAGSINSTGLYKAPSSALSNSVTIMASSDADPSLTAYTTIWVMAPGKVSTTNNPLVAQYSIWTPAGAKAKVEFGPDTSYGRDTWQVSAPSAGGTTNILVAGMRMSSTYHMRAVVDMSDGTEFQDADHSFQTGTLPTSRIPQIAVTTSSTLTPNPGVEFMVLGNDPTQFSTNNPYEAVVTDLQGNVIWYYDVDPTGSSDLSPFPYKLMSNGHMLVYATNVGGGNGVGGDLREIDLAGNVIRSMSVAELNQRLATAGYNLTVAAMHHDFALLPNGHVILLVNHTKTLTVSGYGTISVLGDALVDIDKNWNPVWVWDTFDHLDVNRHPRSLPDWTHGNAIIYSKDDGNLLYSSRNQSWIIKIDYEDGKGSGDIVWKFGYQGDFTLDSGAPAAWTYGQHNIRILSPNTTGTFTLGAFDNGYIRVLDNNGDVCGTSGEPACYSRVPFFQVDETTKTAHVLWQDFPLPYSEAVGSIEQLANGDAEFDEGFLHGNPPDNPYNAHVFEVTQESTPQTVWELDETGQLGYRIYRIPSLYPGVQW